MGKLLSLLRCPNPKDPDIFVDFENARPTAAEEATYQFVENVLARATTTLADLRSYRAGAAAEIRDAISQPQSDEAQRAAWRAVLALSRRHRAYYDFSEEVRAATGMLLAALCSGDMSSTEHLERQQALVRQLAQLLEFTLSFDEVKMSTPALQNDFSYYRRRCDQTRLSAPAPNGEADGEPDITNELGGRISLFLAESQPMMKVLSDSTSKFVSSNKDIPLENTTDCLAKMANICRVMCDNTEYRSRFHDIDKTTLFVLRVMVGVLVLYDHVHPAGAFAKNPNIEMDKFVRVVKNHQGDLALVDVLKYSTKHFNDATTPEHIKKTLA